jgi:hypothetical protein
MMRKDLDVRLAAGCVLGAALVLLCIAASLRSSSFIPDTPVQAAPFLIQSKTIALPGVKGRFDHFALDLKGKRLFVAALGNNTLEAIDLAAGQRLRSLRGLGKPTGVLFLPDLDRLFVACGDDGVLGEFDGRTLERIKTIPGLDDADNIRFDPKAGLIYLGYGAGALAVIRAATAEIVARILLPAHPESFQLERTGTPIFVNVPEAGQIAVIDRERRATAATWPTADFKDNFPMALDEPDRRLFVGCRRPPRLLVLDATSGKRVADLAISGDIDDLFYDAARRRIYASCGEGFVDIIENAGADRFTRQSSIPTRAGARTSFFSPETDEYYLAVPERGPDEAEIRVFKAK